MNIWIASMECAGIAEAGGVKNVTQSLCKTLQSLSHNTTLFIPFYKCTNADNVLFEDEMPLASSVRICDQEAAFIYKRAISLDGNYNIVFIMHEAFSEKEAVYTYTSNEEAQNPLHKKGTGHKDTLFMNTLFAKAVAKYVNYLTPEKKPKIIHCQDASTAMIPLFLENKNIRTVVSIHNAGPAYHHYYANSGEASWYCDIISEAFDGCLNYDKVEPFLVAYKYGAKLATVSEVYAEELSNPFFDKLTENLSSIFFSKGIKITGITNGIDFDRYDPRDTNVSGLPYSFNPKIMDLKGKIKCREYFLDKVNTPIQGENGLIKVFGSIEKELPPNAIFIGYHGRFASQKGIDVLISSISPILQTFDNVYFISMGQGETELEEKMIDKCREHPGKVLFLNGYEKTLARLTTVSSDFMAFPSFYEPCGLEDFIANIYASLPVAHRTGGLNKIINKKTGYTYAPNTSENLVAALTLAITTKMENPSKISKMIVNGFDNVGINYQWNNVIKNKYLPLYEEK